VTPTEKRVHLRFELFAQVQLCRENEVYVMSTENISAGGVFVSGNPSDYPKMVKDAEVELLIFPADNLMLDFNCRARVTRVERAGPGGRSGFGLEFTDLDEHNRSRLARFLRRSTSMPVIRRPPPPPQKDRRSS
jgi:hypothetical protein